MRRDIHRLLSRRGVEHEQDFVWLHQVAQAHQFLNQRLIDLQTARRVEDERVALLRGGELTCFPGNLEHVGLALHHEDRHAELLAERRQLVHGRRTVNIRRDEQRETSLLLKQTGELAGRRRFAGAVKADHHQGGGAALEVQSGVLAAEQTDEFVVDDLDDLLAGMNARDDFLAQRFLAHALDEILHHLEIYVRIQQRHPHVAEAVGDVAL